MQRGGGVERSEGRVIAVVAVGVCEDGQDGICSQLQN